MSDWLINARLDDLALELSPTFIRRRAGDMRLNWKGRGQIGHGFMLTRWNEGDGGMWYGIWSDKKQKWILIIFVKD